MLQLAGKGPIDKCRQMAETALYDGSGYAKLKEMVEAQGGDVRVLEDAERFPKAKAVLEWKAESSGYLQKIDTQACGTAAVLLGAGREKKGDKIDASAGIVLCKKPGERVETGETLAVLYAAAPEKCAAAIRVLTDAYLFGDVPPEKKPLIYSRLNLR